MAIFSIIVPIYKVENFLHSCVESILKQTFEDYELILVDDGSPDRCGNICDEYKQKDHRVRVIHKNNGGLVSARNAGIKIARGEYVGYVDGDDWVAKEWLETVYKVICQNHPDIISYNSYKSVNGTYNVLKTTDFTGFYDNKKVKEQIIPNMLYNDKKQFYSFGVLPAVWAKVIKTELLRHNICRNELITFGEDAACVYGCIAEANSFEGIDDCLYYYRQNRESMTKAYDKNRFERLNYLFTYMEANIVSKAKDIEVQYKYYRFFCIFYAILNEAKSKQSVFKSSQRCIQEFDKYQFQEIFNDIYNMKLGFTWKIIFLFISKGVFCPVLLLCKMISFVKYRYKN